LKYFIDYYNDFIEYVKRLDNVPLFNKTIFFFENTHRNNYIYKAHDYEYKNINIDDANNIFNDLLENGCSWINMYVLYIKKGAIFIGIDNSENFDKYFIGKTDVKFSAQYIAGSYKFYWNLNIYERIKYKKHLKILFKNTSQNGGA
jgi:hypothetical protein